MSRPDLRRSAPQARPHGWRRAFAGFVTGIGLALVVGAFAPGLFGGNAARSKPATMPVSPVALAELDDAALRRLDVAAVNLTCATGLPGAESLDIPAALATLDSWAQRVRFDTERHLYRFRQNPAEYENSEAYFRMLMLTTVIQQDFGVRYNPERATQPDFRDSRDLFIHGLLGEDRSGTCVSMPVLTVAIGRRLGYPLKLAQSKAHVYVRWELPNGEHRNFDATSLGLTTYEDEHYQAWPEPLTPRELASGAYLRALTPREELAVFLTARGHCLEDIGRLAEAQVAYAHAHVLAPAFPNGLPFLAAAVQRERGGPRGNSALPPTFGLRPPLRSNYDPGAIADAINRENAARLRDMTAFPAPSPMIPGGLQ